MATIKPDFPLWAGTSLLTAFTLCFFGPLEILLTQAGAFHFGIRDAIVPLLISFVALLGILFALLSLLAKFGERVFNLGLTLLLVLGVLFYIQGNWVFVNYGIMDGSPIDWSSFHRHALANTAGWIVPLVVAGVLAAWRRTPRMLCLGVAFGLVALEMLSLSILFVSHGLKGGTQSRPDFILTTKGQFNLSANHDNLLVVCSDAFDGHLFQLILQDTPEFQGEFDGFTFFPDNAGTSILSEECGITLLTGNRFDLENVPFKENVEKAYRNSRFLDTLDESGYETSLFLHKRELVAASEAHRISNAIEADKGLFDRIALGKSIFKMVLFRYAPHVLKHYFWYTTMEFDKAMRNVYSWDNLLFLKTLRGKGISCSETRCGVYQFYWLQGPHSPFSMDRNCMPLSPKLIKSVNGGKLKFEQAVGVARIFVEVLHALKRSGIYDNTAVVFVADHGSYGAKVFRTNPLLLVKPRGSHGNMRVSRAPVSMIEDWKHTFLSLIRIDGKDKAPSGRTVFDIGEGEKRNRLAYSYDYDLSIDRRYKGIYPIRIPNGEYTNENPRVFTEYNFGDEMFEYAKQNDKKKENTIV